MPLPKLPPKAAYIHLQNATSRNLLSLAVLQDLRAQLARYHQRPDTKTLALLPAFKPHIIEKVEADAALSTKRLTSMHASPHAWLARAPSWAHIRADQPHVLVLRSEGPVFSDGHDRDELAEVSDLERQKIFAMCAQIGELIRQSPAIVVAPVHGPARDAGFQLAMMADITIAMADTQFQLTGMDVGVPDTGAVTAISRRLHPDLAHRMLMTAEPVTAAEIGGALDIVPVPDQTVTRAMAREQAFEARVAAVVEKLAASSGQAQAFGKWSYATQKGMNFTDAGKWAGRAMVLAMKSDPAAEGLAALKEERKPVWPVWNEGDKPRNREQ